MRIVAALGGNALARRGEVANAEHQVANVRAAAAALAAIIDEGHELVVTHGNGPQVGLLAAQSGGLPLDVLGAESEGMIGYWIDRELTNLLPGRNVAALLTQVVVDAEDPAFDSPSKPIGVVYSEREARVLADERGWRVARDGSGYRRVVASPRPRSIVEIETIALLVDSGVVVVCGGGGGIPVVRSSTGALYGCDAVIDKDRFSALLADQLAADFLLLLTDVEAVFEDWPEPARRPVRRATTAQLRALSFEPGSMGPKIDAACTFAESTGRPAGIGALADAVEILEGTRGTRVDAPWPGGGAAD
jgi:carbamate kinase